MKKRIFAIILAGLMLSSLAACGDSSENNETSGDTAKESNPVSAEIGAENDAPGDTEADTENDAEDDTKEETDDVPSVDEEDGSGQTAIKLSVPSEGSYWFEWPVTNIPGTDEVIYNYQPEGELRDQLLELTALSVNAYNAVVEDSTEDFASCLHPTAITASSGFNDNFAEFMQHTRDIYAEGKDLYDWYWLDEPSAKWAAYYYLLKDMLSSDDIEDMVEDSETELYGEYIAMYTDAMETGDTSELSEEDIDNMIRSNHSFYDLQPDGYDQDESFYSDRASHIISDSDDPFFYIEIDEYEQDGSDLYVNFDIDIFRNGYIYQLHDITAWTVDGEAGSSIFFVDINKEENVTRYGYDGYYGLTREELYEKFSTRVV